MRAAASKLLQSCLTLRPHGLQPTRLLRPWNFPGKSTGVGCHFLLQGIFPTQGSNPGLLNCMQTLYCLSHQGSQSEAEHWNNYIDQWLRGRTKLEEEVLLYQYSNHLQSFSKGFISLGFSHSDMTQRLLDGPKERDF